MTILAKDIKKLWQLARDAHSYQCNAG